MSWSLDYLRRQKPNILPDHRYPPMVPRQQVNVALVSKLCPTLHHPNTFNRSPYRNAKLYRLSNYGRYSPLVWQWLDLKTGSHWVKPFLDRTALVTCDFGWLQKSQRVDLLRLQVMWCHDLNPNRKSVIASCFSSSLAATMPCPHSGKCSKFIYFIYYILLTDNTLSFTRYDTAIPFIFTRTTTLVALSQFPLFNHNGS